MEGCVDFGPLMLFVNNHVLGNHLLVKPLRLVDVFVSKSIGKLSDPVEQ